jgi:Activator of Hsp90 ATPase homolog 1-like protein
LPRLKLLPPALIPGRGGRSAPPPLGTKFTVEVIFRLTPEDLARPAFDLDNFAKPVLDTLEQWFANNVELDPRPGGAGVFRWDDGQERRATVIVADPGERLVIDWDEEGEVEFVVEEVDGGTRLLVRETSPEWSTALELRAEALALV